MLQIEISNFKYFFYVLRVLKHTKKTKIKNFLKNTIFFG
jgi:hypothetical protein